MRRKDTRTRILKVGNAAGVGARGSTFGLGLRLLVLALATAGCAEKTETGKWVQEWREAQAARVRITRNESAVQGCESVGLVSDNDWDDLRKKAARLGGDTAFVMTQQPVSELFLPTVRTVFTAEVYRCRK